MPTKREPGDMGRISKGVPVEWKYLTEYSALRRDGIIVLEWPDFVNESLDHELARYRAEIKAAIEKKRRK